MANNNQKIIVDEQLDMSDDLLCELASAMECNQEKENEEQCLSQKLSQLSASEDDHQNKQFKDSTATITTNKRSSLIESPLVSKKMKINDQKEEEEEEDSKDKIPNYLSMNHRDFQQFIQSMLSTTSNSMNMNDLQDIALRIRQLIMISLQTSLWNTYLQSGTGQLVKEYRLSTIHYQQHELCVWPMEMRSMMMMKEINQIDDHDTCLNYVNQTLSQFFNRQIQYQAQLEQKKYSFKNSFTIEMENAMNRFIEQQELFFIRLEFQSKIAIVKYDYQDRLLELEFHQLKPNEYQLNLFENLTRIKQEKEKSKYEVEMLKQCHRLQLYYHLPESLNSQQLRLPLPPSSLDRIMDLNIRQNLLNHYNTTLKETKSEMMALHINIAEVKMHEYQLKFDQDIVQMRPSDQRSTTNTTNHQQLTPSMIHIIEQRFNTIDERLQYLYNLKMRFLEEKKNKQKN